MKTMSVKSRTLKEANAELREKANGSPVHIHNVSHLHGLAAGLKHGEIIVEGNAGDYLGALNDGATIRVTQDTGNYPADNMTAGTVIIQGNAGFGAAEYCYGGTVVIVGDAGDFTATMNKGATIIVQGNVGDEAGTYMLKGSLIIVGNAGSNLANYLIRGAVYIGGEYRSLGHNTRLAALEDEDIALLKSCFETYGIAANPASFRKIVAASERPFYH